MDSGRRLLGIVVLLPILAISGCSGSTESSGDSKSTVLSPTAQDQRSVGESNDESPDSEESSSSATPEVDQPDQPDQPDQVAASVEERADGIELVFADGMLGPAKLGSTIESLATAMGPEYTIGPAETVRADFPVGYAVSRDGERLFWAVEQDDRIATFMSSNPKVGLPSGLRPKLALEDAIERHGEVTLTLGSAQREFARFADGTGGDETLSVLVAIGDFGGPVGQYEPSSEESPLPESTSFNLEDANIKELWFNLEE